jgi:hypothetical protein
MDGKLELAQVQDVCVELGLDHFWREAKIQAIQVVNQLGGKDSGALITAARARSVEVTRLQDVDIEAQTRLSSVAQQVQGSKAARWATTDNHNPAAVIQAHYDSVLATGWRGNNIDNYGS